MILSTVDFLEVSLNFKTNIIVMSYKFSGLLSNLGKTLSSIHLNMSCKIWGHFQFSYVVVKLLFSELIMLIN